MSLGPCRFCGEDVPADAERCPGCAETAEKVSRPEDVRRRLIAKERALRGLSAGERREALSPPAGGRLRRCTLLSKAAALLCFGAALWAGWMHDPPMRHWGIFLVAGISALALYLRLLVQDLRVPRPGKRTTPIRGLRAFLCALITERYAYARACLVPGECDARTRRQPEIEDLGVFGRHYEFERLDGFRRYWRGIVRPSRKLARQLHWVRVGEFRLERESGDFALVSCRFRVSLWDSQLEGGEYALLNSPFLRWLKELIDLFTPRSYSAELTKTLRRIDDEWYLVNGEMQSPEDTPGALDEALRLSRLEDAELNAEAG